MPGIVVSSGSSVKCDVKLVIVGEGSMREQLKKDAAYLGVSSHVIFTGYLDDCTVINLLKAADVIVVPSLYEPFGIVALAAMAAKTPVVASDVGGLSELISDGESVKVLPNNSERLAEGIIKILFVEDDDKRRVELEEMIEKGFQKVRSSNWDKISEATINVYTKVLTSVQNPTVTSMRWKDINIGIETEKGEIWKYRYS